jgi:hypothetical protein
VQPGGTINTFSLVLRFFVRTVFVHVFYLALFMLGISLAGNRVIAVFLSALIAFFPVLVYMLGDIVAVRYVFGFGDFMEFTHSQALLTLTHPAMLGAVFNGSQRLFSVWGYYGVYTLILLAMFGAAYGCCMHRKSERTGDSVVFYPIRSVMVFLVALAGMVLGGVVFTVLFMSPVWYYVGFAFGFVLLYIIAQMVAEKTLQIRHRLKEIWLFGGLVAGLYVGVLGGYASGDVAIYTACACGGRSCVCDHAVYATG